MCFSLNCKKGLKKNKTKNWNEAMNFQRKMAMKNQDVSWTVPQAQKALAVLSPITCCSSFPTRSSPPFKYQESWDTALPLQTREGHIGSTHLKCVWNSQPWSLSRWLETIAFVISMFRERPHSCVYLTFIYMIQKKVSKYKLRWIWMFLNHFYIKLSLYGVWFQNQYFGNKICQPILFSIRK